MLLIKKFREVLRRFTTNEKLIRNLLWLTGDKILRYLISLVVVVWTARYLGPANNGILSYALTYTSLFGALASFGMGTIALTDLSKQPERVNSILGTAASIMIAGALISLLAQTIVISQIRPGDTLMHTLVLIIGLSYIIRPLHSAVSIYYQAKPDYKPIVITANIAFIAVSLLKVVALSFSCGLNVLAAITSLEIGLLGVILTYYYQKTTSGIGCWQFDKSLFLRYLKHGFPLFMAGIFTDINNRFDIIMIADMHSNQEAGIYSVAVILVQIWYFVPVIIYNAIFPNLAKVSNSNHDLFRKKIQTLYNYMAVLSYAICIPITLFSSVIVNILYGEAYQKSGMVLCMLIWSAAFVNMGIPRNAYIFSLGYYRLQFKITLTSCVINILFNLILIPTYGAFGAAISTLVSYSYASFFSNFFYSEIRENGWMILKSVTNFAYIRSSYREIKNGNQ